MEKTIFLHGRLVKYTIERKHGRGLKVIVAHNEAIRIIAPLAETEEEINKFLREKAKWIIRKIQSVKNLVPLESLKKVDHIYTCQHEVRNFIVERLKYYNTFYRLSYNRIHVKNHSSRWGSCTFRKELNFNYRILFLPLELADYVIVHELCHLKEMNHGHDFWNLVAKSLPDYKERRKKLKRIIFN